MSRITTVTARATSSVSTRPTLRRGAEGSPVVDLQKRLRAAGFNPGAADGDFGPKTLAAVKAFQRARGLVADGVVGPKTWAKLVARSVTTGPVLRYGARTASVKILQSRLNQLGFHVGAADGHFGPKTLAGVKAFQRSRGLAADGVVGPKTWAKLGVNGASGSTGSSSRGVAVTGYVRGVAKRITLSAIPNGKYLRSDAAAAFNRMYAAARSAGVSLPVNSGFRSMSQQKYLYSLYLQGRGNLAARPGYSNHQGGIAVDISVGSTSSRTYRWLAANASKYGFKRTVASEPWHWEYRR